MFGGLKKRLETAIKKIAGKVEPIEDRKEEKKSRFDDIKERVEDKIEEIQETREEQKPRSIEDRIEEELAERKERMEDLEEKIAQEELESKIDGDADLLREEKEILEEVKAEVLVEKILEVPSPKRKLGFLDKLKRKTVEKVLSDSDIQNILQELQIALLENDVALEVAEKICADVKTDLLGKTVKRGKVEDIIKESLKKAILDILQQPEINIEHRIKEKNGPFLIMMIGFNGVG
ncbi:MAG: signal recognition particle receptor subunit alpha, partial [Candidatus Aenigmatarchaeota archaeon]